MIQEEWDVPIVPCQSLGKQDGIALVPRRELASVIRVGFTAHRVAILLTEPPEKLGAGYHKEQVRIRLLALNEDGDKVETSALHYLVQIGFGSHVNQIMNGPQTEMYFTQRKMTGKMPEALWPSGQKPASLTRQDGSRAFYVYSDFVDTILRASGQGNFFTKETVPAGEYHQLWLDEEVSQLH